MRRDINVEKHYPNWYWISDHLFIILIICGSGCGATNAPNLKNHQPDIKFKTQNYKIYLYPEKQNKL